VDFVLESGNGDIEDGKDLQVNNGSADEELHQGDRTHSPDSHPEAQHRNVRLRQRDQASQDENRASSFYPTGVGRELRSGRRNWPLRDPEEAYLLKHFVDRIASFVRLSPRVNVNGKGECTDIERTPVRLYRSTAALCSAHPLSSTVLQYTIQCPDGSIGASFELHHAFQSICVRSILSNVPRDSHPGFE